MLRVSTGNITSGMTLAVAVFNPRQPDHTLLKPGYELSPSIIRRLLELGIEQVFIRCPALDHVTKYLNPQLLQQRAELASHTIDAFELMQSNAHPNLNFSQYIATFSRMVETVVSHPASGIFYDVPGGQRSALADHMMRVAYLATLMGVKLDHYLIRQRKHLSPNHARNVTNLGLGAMLHDVGLLRMPPELQNPHEIDNPQWREHIQIGLDMVGQSVSPSVRAVIYQHHQHFDGTGFPDVNRGQNEDPAPMAGEKIHVFARIVAAAKRFDLLCEGPVRRHLPIVGLKQMLDPALAVKFDPVVTEALFAVTPPFPPGTMVKLNDERYGAIVSHNPSRPCRPMVHLFDKQDHTPADGADSVINLAQEEYEQTFIAEADGVPIEQHLFELPEPADSWNHNPFAMSA